MLSKLQNPHVVADLLDRAGFEIEAARLLSNPSTNAFMKSFKWCVGQARAQKQMKLLTEISIVME